MGGIVKDLRGRLFTRWTVLDRAGCIGNHAAWKCECSCSRRTVRVVSSRSLIRGDSKSCGCLYREMRSLTSIKHGANRKGEVIAEYRSWQAMKRRCNSPTHVGFHLYGGRGITVCSRWLNSFDNFLVDMGPKPSEKHSLDRIDVDGNYEPKNCRWATPEMQSQNKRVHGGPSRKLRDDEVDDINLFLAVGMNQRLIARQFKIPLPLIKNIRRGTTYSYTKGARWRD